MGSARIAEAAGPISASLPEIQARLKAHFAALAQLRAEGAPVFALEHNLSEGEFKAMAAALNASLRATIAPSDVWLAWVVYAAEVGYNFDGDEYWQSFEDRTPYWRAHGDRNQVRSWFHRFHKEFAGIKPSGPWAQHFTIISWPITHAILPRDLQYQFARTLHYARHSLARAGSIDAAYLGGLIRREAWHASSRFQQFAQQEAVVGRLALAILGAEEAQGDRILREDTLRRIVRDLEETRQAKEWLEDARSTVVRFKGLNRLAAGATPANGASSPAQLNSRQPNLRPTLLLARTGINRWEVRVEVPSFGELLNQSDELRSFLSRTRSKVSGSSENFVPSSWLLGSNRVRKLLRWPGHNAPIIQFERPNLSLDTLLAVDGAFSKGPVWPCRVHEDGTASEVQGRQVRPNQTYILLSALDLSEMDNTMMTRCEIDCEGVKAFQLKISDSVSAPQDALIAKLGLQLCRTMRLWPAGLAARRWDGEGSCEWLTIEKPTFGIVHDHPLESYAVSVNGGPETLLNAGEPGQAVFITLPELEAGTHILKVRAFPTRQGKVSSDQRQAEGMVVMTVREPSTWVPGTTAHGGLVVNVEPGMSNLDDLMTNRLHLQILGPDDRQVELALRTIVPPSDGWVARQKIALPKSISNWTELIGAAEEDLTVASRAELVILGEELGEFRIPLEREAAPLRWACKRGTSTSLRMIDEAGDDQPPRVTLRPFGSPAHPTALDPEICRQSFTVKPPGGLFHVESDGGEDAIIISVQPAGHHLGLDTMVVQPILVGVDEHISTYSGLLGLTDLWRRARAVGWLANMRKALVLQTLEARFYARLCGQRWGSAEATYLTNKNLQALGENIGHTYEAKSFSAVLRKGQLAGMTGTQQAEWFADVAARYNICSDPVLSNLALRLTTDPWSVRIEKAEEFDGEVAKLASYEMLTRGARLAALLSDGGIWQW